MLKQEIDVQTAELQFAITALRRTHELIEDGWLQGGLADGKRSSKVENFCVHGALHLALSEIFPNVKGEFQRVAVCAGATAQESGFGAAEAIATAMMVEEAADVFGYDRNMWRENMMGMASFNDAADRTKEQVLSVIDGAITRLVRMSYGEDDEASSYTEVYEEPIQMVNAQA